MKFALVDGQRREAQPNLLGECPACGSPVVAKCGQVRVRHWAHKGRRQCDPWWENETEWHRNWKNQFPTDWQEVCYTAKSGERHIADVLTNRGWVIEFQHSYLKPEERRSRQAFYPKLIWVVDGKRRKRDEAHFAKAFDTGRPVGVLRRALVRDCDLLREWSASSGPVLLDFGGDWLWWLLGWTSDGATYVIRFSRAQFVDSHRGGEPQLARMFDEFVDGLPKQISEMESLLRTLSSMRSTPQPRRARRHFRF